MDAAFLHNSIFNIESKRRELDQQHLSREEVIKWFNNNYRVFSKKNAFTCIYCNKPVNMNLTKEEGRPFYFRHIDGSECNYSKNVKTYSNTIEKYEDFSKKQIGLTVFNEILMGELKPFNVQIERGFHYKKKLSFIPDFIIRFQSTEEKWAIDYFTSINQAVQSGSYARQLANRMKTYEEEAFKSFSFVDISWLSYIEETNKGTLLKAETYVARKTNEDYLWDNFLEQNIKDELEDFFEKEIGCAINEFNARNIVYVDVANRLCTVLRFLQVSEQQKTITYYKLASYDIPLSEALSLNADQNQFALSKENEDEMRNEFLNKLLERKRGFEIEQQRLSELPKLSRNDEELLIHQLKHRSTSEGSWKLDRLKINSRESEIAEDEQVEKEMQERIRIASLRPIEINPNTRRKDEPYRDDYERYTYQQNTSISRYLTMKESAVEKKKEKVKEILLTQPIKGEIYINSNRSEWRLLLLKWIKENQADGSLIVSLEKIIEYLKRSGISFNQQDTLVNYPLKEFLIFYAKVMRSELKKKVEINLID